MDSHCSFLFFFFLRNELLLDLLRPQNLEKEFVFLFSSFLPQKEQKKIRALKQ